MILIKGKEEGKKEERDQDKCLVGLGTEDKIPTTNKILKILSEKPLLFKRGGILVFSPCRVLEKFLLFKNTAAES